MKLKKGDTVLITAGKDKGKRGKILEAFPQQSQLLVEGVNLRKKHRRPRKQGEKGQVITLPGVISVSNAKLICSKCGKAVRIAYKLAGAKKIRICKKCGQVL